MKLKIALFLTILLFLSHATLASALTLYARTCAEIQPAIDRAVDGDIVSISAMTCDISETIYWANKAITVKGTGKARTILVDKTPIGGDVIDVEMQFDKAFLITSIGLVNRNIDKAYTDSCLIRIVGTGTTKGKITNVGFKSTACSVGIQEMGDTSSVVNVEGTSLSFEQTAYPMPK
jgi:hypothetical protein